MSKNKATVVIEPTNKNRIIVGAVDNNNNNNNDDEEEDDYMDDFYNEEKRREYSEMTLLIIQKSLLEYVDKKNLTLCEYLSTSEINEYLVYS